MAEENYAFIKNGKIVNIVVFDNPSEELLEEFKELHNVDSIINVAGNLKAAIEGTFDGIDFILPQPYPSWTLDENKDWKAPIEQPDDGKRYIWNEEIMSWEEYTPLT